jgi:hypothetical protein
MAKAEKLRSKTHELEKVDASKLIYPKKGLASSTVKKSKPRKKSQGPTKAESQNEYNINYNINFNGHNNKKKIEGNFFFPSLSKMKRKGKKDKDLEKNKKPRFSKNKTTHNGLPVSPEDQKPRKVANVTD